MFWKSLSFSVLCFGLICSANAQETQYINSVTENLLNGPGGSRVGVLYRNKDVEVLKVEGKWAQVRTIGWVKASKLVGKARAKKNSGKLPSVVGVENFEVQTPDPGSSGEERAYLILQAKNLMKRVMPGFKALLVVKHDGKVLFREPVTYELEPIGPGRTAKIVFSWEKSEEQFDYLTSIPAKKLEVKLLRTKVLEF